MNINSKPEFNHIIATGGQQLQPTVVEPLAGVITDTIWNTAGQLRSHVVAIGSWNMDSTASKVIDSGLAIAIDHIIGIRASLIRDVDGVIFDIHYSLGTYGTGERGMTVSAGAPNVNVFLARATGGYFDGGDFNDPIPNRGWVIIDYYD